MKELADLALDLATLCLWLMSLTMSLTNQRPKGVASVFDRASIVFLGFALMARIVSAV